VEQLRLFLVMLYTASQVQELLRLLLRQAVAALLNTLLSLEVAVDQVQGVLALALVVIEQL
tara:strand:+ start:259 stop:441 length:183 start_codon:yes stop_codon:yes gene_type:complete